MTNLCLKIKKSHIFVALFCVLMIAALQCLPIIYSSTRPAPSVTVVIDAGHGGIDGGSVGVGTGKDENYINLDYALTLKKIMEKYNLNLVLTRTNLNGLYSQFAENKKIDDMEKRKEIVLNAKADIVLSIHMNSFPLKSCRGAQVFYKKDDASSKVLADSIQSVFIETLPEARKSTSIGDYYMLNEFNVPSVIIECGYISNPEEEALLLTEEYKNLVCSSIFLGVIKFLSY